MENSDEFKPMHLKRNIRAAQPEDADKLKHCMHAAYSGYLQRMDGARLPPMDIDYLLEINNFPTWVVTIGSDIVGGLTMDFENNYASIANIAIDPEFQGQDIGGDLMEFAQLQAKENNCSELRLATHVLLEESIALYLHLGWHEKGRDETRVFFSKGV